MEAVKQRTLKETLRNLDLYPTEFIMEKAISCYQLVRWSKQRKPTAESPSASTKDIKGMKNRNSKIINHILHRDNSLTLITSDNYYIKFSNQWP